MVNIANLTRAKQRQEHCRDEANTEGYGQDCLYLGVALSKHCAFSFISAEAEPCIFGIIGSRHPGTRHTLLKALPSQAICKYQV